MSSNINVQIWMKNEALGCFGAQLDRDSGRLNISILNTSILYRKLLSSHFLKHQSVNYQIKLFRIIFHLSTEHLTWRAKENSTFLTSLMTVENVYWTDESGRPRKPKVLHFPIRCRQNKSTELSGFYFGIPTQKRY